MLILSDVDITGAIDFRDLLECAERAMLLQEEGGFFMPDRIHLEYQGNTHLLMPALDERHMATKLVSVYPGNRQKGKPVVQGLVVLQDSQTGEPLALMNGARITALRTGAVGALGLAYTSPKETETLAIVGAGEQGYHQALMACTVRNIRKIGVYDPFASSVGDFIGRLRKGLPDIQVAEYKDIRKLVGASQAVIAATSSPTPVIPDDEGLVRGRHFIGIGSFRPEMREFPDALYRAVGSIFIDTPLAIRESGDVAYPLQKGYVGEGQVVTLGKLILGKAGIDDTQTTFFKSVGMALFDLVTAATLYDRARERGIGLDTAF